MAARRFSIYAPVPSDLGRAVPPVKPKAQAAAAVSNPIAIPGSAESLQPWSLRPHTPQQGGEGKRSALLRQASDAKLDASDGAAAVEEASTIAAAPAAATPQTTEQVLGSWAARQTVLPLPPRPVGFPAPVTKARLQPAMPRPQHSAADAAWRYRFRQKWRREQLRHLMDWPDNSPDHEADGMRPSLESLDGDDGMVFRLDGDPAAAGSRPEAAGPAPKAPASAPAACLSAAAPPLPQSSLAPAAAPRAASAAAAAAAPAQPLRQVTLKMARLPAAAEDPSADPLQAAVPGLPPIRKAVMRGRRALAAAAGPAAKAAQGAGALGVKAQAPLQQGRWVPPEWTSPARASQAA